MFGLACQPSEPTAFNHSLNMQLLEPHALHNTLWGAPKAWVGKKSTSQGPVEVLNLEPHSKARILKRHLQMHHNNFIYVREEYRQISSMFCPPVNCALVVVLGRPEALS